MPKISLGVPRLPWPKKGDEPFRSSADAKSEARLDMVHRSLYSYALAYKEAADRLVNCALGRRAVHLDLAVLPGNVLVSPLFRVGAQEHNLSRSKMRSRRSWYFPHTRPVSTLEGRSFCFGRALAWAISNRIGCSGELRV